MGVTPRGYLAASTGGSFMTLALAVAVIAPLAVLTTVALIAQLGVVSSRSAGRRR